MSTIEIGPRNGIECGTCGATDFGPLTSAIAHPDRDQYEVGNSLGTRGEFAEIQIDDHRMVIANHKGHLIVGLVCLR